MKQLDIFKQRVRSISYSEEEIILNILELHSPAGEINIDPTYSKGVFYQGRVPQPLLKSDIDPQLENCDKADCRNLPLLDASVGCIMFDPPFLIAMENNPDSIMSNRFSSFRNWDELVSMYSDSLKEFYRITRKGGIVIFKCQDVTNGGYQFFSHVAIMQLAVRIGWYPKDLFILMKKNRLTNKKTNQKHARKHHSYFWVFQKLDRKSYFV